MKKASLNVEEKVVYGMEEIQFYFYYYSFSNVGLMNIILLSLTVYKHKPKNKPNDIFMLISCLFGFFGSIQFDINHRDEDLYMIYIG